MSTGLLDGSRWSTSFWRILPFFFFGIVFFVSMLVLLSTFSVPDKWDRAVALGVCGGIPILQLKDGSIWLRKNGFRTYRIENLEGLRCNK